MLGDEEVLYAFYDAPSLIHDMLETITEFNIKLIQRALHEAPITWVQIWEDMCYTAGPLISPEMFRSFLMPYYLRLTEAIHSAGVDLIMVDSDGDVAELISLWLEAGVSGVYPMEQAAGNDLWSYRSRYGSSLGMAGGIDKRVLAMDKAAIDRELEIKIGLALEGGYLPVHDHTIPTDVSYANYMYYLERKRKLIGLE
ncbi:MAG: uroporphyrinogen decarboxylase family protein [Anaerolineae bacterium]